ncbi:MAG: hypothetical protein ACYDA2_03920 [Acidimicrobiales bacterium]
MADTSPPRPPLAPTRAALHVVSTHILGRRRFAATGRFGLRAAPGGFTTGPFGDGPETLRVAGGVLVRETAGDAAYRPMDGASLRELAAFAGADLDGEFSAGSDTPPLGDLDAPLRVDGAVAAGLADWLGLGWCVLDAVVAAMAPSAAPATVQLWPEHFDAGTNVALPDGTRVNLGFSPGDGAVDEPYAYVSPWEPARPGDPSYWNAPFGAVLRRSAAGRPPGRFAVCRAFLERGLAVLSEQ